MRIGTTAPDFELADHSGERRALTELTAAGPVVLFFYPAANSPICTAQACHFRDLGTEFERLGAQRIGISTDTRDRNQHFALQRAFDFPLLSDSDGAVAEQFGVRRGGWLTRKRRLRELERGHSTAARRGLVRQLLSVKRTTFVIDRHRVVRMVVRSERGHVHATKALDYLRYLS
ncbi:peroxiredoxin [Rhodococcus sp. KRD162]|uniref:peroxiredoxin n=1 Tax=Rhodococcus sp. KRD162 TaxID=2729725 RepID=UPI0019CF7D42|nr:peroxiredoxin [Rhodococcus sp. KRD162]